MKAKLNVTYPFGNDYNLNKGLLKAITGFADLNDEELNALCTMTMSAIFCLDAEVQKRRMSKNEN